jgi:cytochrome c553
MNVRKPLILSMLAMSIPALAQHASATDTPAKTTTATTSTTPMRTAAASAPGAQLYVVKEGNKVDNKTLLGWRTWRALACERCHGAEQEGLVGPPLVQSMKKLSKEEFHKTLMDGRPEKGMPPFSASKMVNDNWEGLYGYLMGRADGKIKPGHVYAIDAKK